MSLEAAALAPLFLEPLLPSVASARLAAWAAAHPDDGMALYLLGQTRLAEGHFEAADQSSPVGG